MSARVNCRGADGSYCDCCGFFLPDKLNHLDDNQITALVLLKSKFITPNATPRDVLRPILKSRYVFLHFGAVKSRSHFSARQERQYFLGQAKTHRAYGGEMNEWKDPR